MVAANPELAALGRAVKKNSRAAARLSSKAGWKGFLLLVMLLSDWLKGTDMGANILALPDVGGDEAKAIAYLMDLQKAGAVAFRYEGDADNTTSFHVELGPGVANSA